MECCTEGTQHPLHFDQIAIHRGPLVLLQGAQLDTQDQLRV